MLSETTIKLWQESTKSIVRDIKGNIVHYSCRFCAKTIVRQDYFKTHVHRQHYMHLQIEKPAKNVKCLECEFEFYTKAELNSHVRNKHKKIPCIAGSLTASSSASPNERHNANEVDHPVDTPMSLDMCQPIRVEFVFDDIIEYVGEDDESEVTSSTDDVPKYEQQVFVKRLNI